MIAACAEAPIDEFIEPDESSAKAGAEDGRKDAAASDARSSEEEDEDDESGNDDDENAGDDEVDQGGEVAEPRDAGPPRGAVNGGRDSGVASVARDSATRTDTGSGSGTGDDGSTDPGSATSGMARCGGASADACTECLCTRCASEMETCYASGDATKDRQCAAIEECAEQNSCVSTECYCGSSLLCLSPAGLCVDVIQAAAGSMVTSDITAAREDPQNPVGRANTLTTCGDRSCRQQCGF